MVGYTEVEPIFGDYARRRVASNYRLAGCAGKIGAVKPAFWRLTGVRHRRTKKAQDALLRAHAVYGAGGQQGERCEVRIKRFPNDLPV
jgi:hypothetical protein